MSQGFNNEKDDSQDKKKAIRKIVKEYNSSAYVTTIEHEKIKNDTAIQIFTKNGPLAFLPVSPTENGGKL